MIPDVVPKALCERSAAALCEFIGVDPEDPDTWRNYVTHGHGIIPLHHHQALWDVRQLPQLHEFSAPSTDAEAVGQFRSRLVQGAEQLPRVGFPHGRGALGRRPARAERSRRAGARLPDRHAGRKRRVRDGAASCIARSTSGSRLARSDARSPPTRRIGLSAGAGRRPARQRRDLAPKMPHTSLANNSTKPRLVQYVTMTPAGSEESRLRNARECIEKHPPAWARQAEGCAGNSTRNPARRRS